MIDITGIADLDRCLIGFPSFVQAAAEFAARAHKGQVRKYTGEPYIHHPVAVMRLVATRPHVPDLLAAALLHDVLEDTAVTSDELRFTFGHNVTNMVLAVTDVSKPADGNRSQRKAIDREHLARAWPAAKTIKLADLIDNTGSIVECDPGFAKVYIREKLWLLEVLTDGDPVLWAQAKAIAEDAAARLGLFDTEITT